jgi:predicted CXXCH cytochrome family protein
MRRASLTGCGWAVLLAMLLHVAAAIAEPKDVAENRECATCHVMWLNDFKRSDVTPLIPYDPRPRVDTGRQDVSSTERMCFSCHDGFMLESRAVWRSDQHAHPVGVKPSDKVKIPTSKGKTIFPLNDDGKLYCGTCHSAHGVDWKQDESPVFMRIKNVDSSLCFACHLERSTGPIEGNHPVLEKIDQPPAVLSENGARFGHGGTVICQSCHRTHGSPQKKMLVLNNENSELCGSCHTDKAKIKKSKHDMSVMAPEARNIQNRSVAESGPCGVCHLPHKANGPALWARDVYPEVDSMSARCLSCHNPKGLAKKKTVGEHSHPVNVPVADAGIIASVKGWVSRFPLPDAKQPLTRLPLYDDKGLRTVRGGKVGCATCHDPHRWSSVAADMPVDAPADDPHKIEGDGQSSFLRIPFDSTNRLCANCHVDKAAVVFSKHNPAVMNPPDPNATADVSRDGGSKTVSGTAAKPGHAVKPNIQGVCATCHQPHNAKGNFLWARDSGPVKGATAVLCTSCHRAGGAADNKTGGKHSHPIDQPLKVGMQSQLPRFGASGRDETADAKIDCATCHDPHQWDPASIANRAGASALAEGDAGNSFLRLPASGRAELCVDCHRQQRLVRGTDHDLSVSAPRAVNAQGKTTAESGVCGQCHTVHNAANDLRLWARVPGEGQDKGEKLCRSCHALGQVAEAKVPPESRHPPMVMAWSPELRLRFNAKAILGIGVYNQDGLPDATGVISCASCHNPHQWSPRTLAEGPGKNTEGDVNSSFLRLTNTESFMCADCHGRDALFRYKYFHGKSSHKDYRLFR